MEDTHNYVHETISIQGLIGCGKTTFINILRKKEGLLKQIFGKPVFFVDEPVKEWRKKCYENNTKSALEIFYNDPIKNGFTFQIQTFTTRMKYLKVETSRLNELSICIIDRSMKSDRDIFFKNLEKDISEIDKNTYSMFYDLMCEDSNKIEKRMIYFTCEPEDCFTRIKLRNNKDEKGITLELLQDHHVLHQQMIKDFEKSGGIVYKFYWPFIKDSEQKLEDYVDEFLNTIK